MGQHALQRSFSSASCVWKSGAGGSRWASFARAHARGSLPGRLRARSPGGTRGAHASHSSLRRRVTSSAVSMSRRSCLATRTRRPAAASPRPTDTTGGGVHPFSAAHFATTRASAEGRNELVFPGRRFSARAHWRTVSVAVAGSSPPKGSVGSTPQSICGVESTGDNHWRSGGRALPIHQHHAYSQHAFTPSPMPFVKPRAPVPAPSPASQACQQRASRLGLGSRT